MMEIKPKVNHQRKHRKSSTFKPVKAAGTIKAAKPTATMKTTKASAR